MNIDNNVIIRCLKGDRKAQHELYLICHPILLNTCLRYTKEKNEAISMMNLGFVKIINKLGKYKAEFSFNAWIKKIMVNMLIDHYRSDMARRAMITYVDDINDIKHIQSDILTTEYDFDAENIIELITLLPPVTQLVFNMFAIDGYSHREIAEKLEIKEGTSKWHVNNARNLLQQEIKNRYPQLFNKYENKKTV